MRIAKNVGVAFAVAGLVAIAFLAGLRLGVHRGLSVMQDMLETQVAGTLNFAIEELLLIRFGDADRAIHLLETQVDAAVGSLPQQRAWLEVPPSTRTSLLVAKRYRETYPPAQVSSALQEALAFIPDEPLDPDSCRPAVRQLLISGSAGNS